MARLGAGGLALLFAFTTLYVAAFHTPRAKGLDVGVVGSAAEAAQLQSALDVRARGAATARWARRHSSLKVQSRRWSFFMDVTNRPPAALMGGPRPRNWNLRYVTVLVAGVALVACSVALIVGGALAAFVASGGTYVDLGGHGSYATDRYALATDSTNWRTTVFGWAGSVRLKVAPEDGKAIFVGVAAPAAVGRYLAGAGYTTIGEHSGRGVVRTDHDGAMPATPPAKAVDWTAQAQGVGTQTLRWNATDGRQIAFAMNADGSRPVRVRVESSAVTLDRMPWWVPVGVVALGLAVLPAGIMFLRRTFRPRTRT